MWNRIIVEYVLSIYVVTGCRYQVVKEKVSFISKSWQRSKKTNHNLTTLFSSPLPSPPPLFFRLARFVESQ